MSPEEARIIRDVFDRLRSMAPTRDPEAQSAIEAELRANPQAAMGLVQAVVALDRDRQDLEARIAELERGTPSRQGGSLFGTPGPWGRTSQAPQPDTSRGWQQPAPAPQAPPAPQPPAASGGGGIFSTILGAATGLAAGYVGYEAMKGIFGGGHGGGLFGGSGSDNDAVLRGGYEPQERTAADDAAFFDSDDGGGDDGFFDA